MKQTLTAADVTGLVAVVPTPARPDAASWHATQTVSAACGMSPLIKLREAILNGHNTTADLITRDINDSYAPLFPMGDFALFSTYNIPLEKARIAAASLIDPGPPRPPYHQCPAEYRAGATDAGRRWAALERKYQPTVTNHQG